MTTPKEYQDAFWRAHPTVPVPVGDDTKCGYCGAAFDQHDPPAMRDCNRLLRAALDNALTDVAGGDDTPAPTQIADALVALQRAGAAPDLTALPSARIIEHINQTITLGLSQEHPTHGLSLILDEEGQHEAVKAVLAAVAALVREDTTDAG